MIGRLRNVVLDCPEPLSLARFYSTLLDAEIVTTEPTWVVIEDQDKRRMAFQRAPEYRPPTFPDPAGSQQFHLDVLIDDVDEAERAVLALGARRLDGDGEDFRVFADPVGHPFCLMWLT